MQSDHFSHAFQSTTFTVQEFEEDSQHLSTYLQSLGENLNSNQDFEANDTFTMEITLVRTPVSGGGDGREKKLGRLAVDKVLKAKKSIVCINNEDQLCCAGAIVTMKAFADGCTHLSGY